MNRTKKFQFKATDLTEEGELEAVFSVFDIVDSDGDVVKSSAIHDGKAIPLVWAHDWSKPIGKGTIVNDGKRAIFKGKFFTETAMGMEAYKTVKAMGDLQEYSWGFRILDESKGEKDGKVVNEINDTEEFEVSPVLIGANRETETIGIKEKKEYLDVEITGSHEQLRDQLNSAFRERQFEGNQYLGYSYVVATYDDKFIAMMWKWDDEEDSYWEVTYTRADDGTITLGDPKQVEAVTEFVPLLLSDGTAQMSYEQHSDYVRVAVTGLLRRSKTGSELRRKAGRTLSDARRSSIEDAISFLGDAKSELYKLLEADPTQTDVRELYAQFLRVESQLVGVN